MIVEAEEPPDGQIEPVCPLRIAGNCECASAGVGDGGDLDRLLVEGGL